MTARKLVKLLHNATAAGVRTLIGATVGNTQYEPHSPRVWSSRPRRGRRA